MKNFRQNLDLPQAALTDDANLNFNIWSLEKPQPFPNNTALLGPPQHAIAYKIKKADRIHSNPSYDGWELPGKVSFERVIRYTEFEINHTGKADQKNYLYYKNFTSKHVSIDFQWAIESQIPPLSVLSPTLDPKYSTENQAFAMLSQNAPIKEIHIRIRQLRGKPNTKGSIKITQSPWDDVNYIEIGYIVVPTNLLPLPPTTGKSDSNSGNRNHMGLNDTNRALFQYKPANIEKLYGYVAACVRFNTNGEAFLYKNYNQPGDDPELTKLNIVWTFPDELVNGGLPPNTPFEPRKFYYLTVEPLNNPINRINQNDSVGFSHYSIPSDGYYGYDRVFPASYFWTSWTENKNGGGFKNSFSGGGMPLTGPSVRLNKRYRWGNPLDGGWTYLANQGVSQDLSSYRFGISRYRAIERMEEGGRYWDDNDSKLPFDAFFTWGMNIPRALEAQAEYALFWQGPAVADQIKYGAQRMSRHEYYEEVACLFAWFKTPIQEQTTAPTKLTMPASVPLEKPVVKNDGFVNEQLTPSTFKTTITGHFYYQKMSIYAESDFNQNEIIYPTLYTEALKYIGTFRNPQEFARKCGFRWRDRTKNQDWINVEVKQTNKDADMVYSNYVRDGIKIKDPSSGALVTFTDDQSRKVSFSYVINNIPISSSIEYQIWVDRLDGQRFYADPNKIAKEMYFGDKNGTGPNNYPIYISNVNLGQYFQPDPQSEGNWYQIFDAWETGSLQTGKKLFPYLYLKNKNVNTDQFGNFLSTTSNRTEGPHSIHYYLNRQFYKDKTYQFRIVVEDFYNLQKDRFQNSTTYETLSESKFSFVTPWGEEFKINRPYLPTTLATNEGDAVVRVGTPNRFNFYLYTNINSYESLSDRPEKPINAILSTSNPQNPITIKMSTKDVHTGLRYPYATISYVGINEHDWVLQGFGAFSVMTQLNDGIVKNIGTEAPFFLDSNSGELVGGRGWHFLANENRLVWFDRLGPKETNPLTNKVGYEIDLTENLPVGGNVQDYLSMKSQRINYLVNNFAAIYISYQKFNVSFDYTNLADFGVTMYIGGELPSSYGHRTNIEELIAAGIVKKVANITENVQSPIAKRTLNFVGLTGNQYIFFVAQPVIEFYDEQTLEMNTKNIKVNSSQGLEFVVPGPANGYDLSNGRTGYGTYSIIGLSNFKFTAAYAKVNNQITNTNFTLNDWSPSPSLTGVKYQIDLGNFNDVILNAPNSKTTVYSKAGNGSFVSGIWENGVWNNGWRDDYTVREFYSVDAVFRVTEKTWRITISGPTSAVESFRLADKVSVSNLAIIDINEERKLYKDYMVIVEKTSSSMILEFDWNFEIRRVEKDSNEHRVLISRNIWLKGVFFNGLFKGIWNDGLFSGYPLITKMQDSHWIDGVFNGGHFQADKLRMSFSGDGVEQYDLNNTPRTAITFDRPHRLTKNDVIAITYSTQNDVKTFGTTVVLDVPNENKIVTGVSWTPDTVNLLEGTIYSVISTGLIQNFSFYANNVSTVTSIESMSSTRVFSYNSWIDVNYSNQSAINLGRPENYNDPTSNRLYSENNLFGYPTRDVVTSVSVFRDSFSLQLRRYRLGKRYKVLENFVGDSSTFEDYFDSTDKPDGLSEFYANGWTLDRRPDSFTSLITSSQSQDSMTVSNQTDDYLSLYIPDGTLTFFEVGQNILISGPFVETSGTQFGISYRPTYKETQATVLELSKVDRNLLKVVTDSKLFVAPTGTNNIPNGGFWYIGQPQNNNYSSEDFQSLDYILGFNTRSGLTFSRTNQPTNGNAVLVGKELDAVTSGGGGVLNLIPADDIPNRSNGTVKKTIKKFRYSVIEFDLLSIRGATASNSYLDPEVGDVPSIHFNNLNITTREQQSKLNTKVLKRKNATYLPVYKNVNHVNTFGTKKQEFFFNKRNLMMNLTGTGILGTNETEYLIDNLNLYEVDMIPFFQYFTEENINISAQIPNSTDIFGTAPIIDFEDDEQGLSSNDVQSKYNNLLNVPVLIPSKINWESDYGLFSDQATLAQILDLYGDVTKSLPKKNTNVPNTGGGTTGGGTTGGGTTGGGTTGGGTTGGGTTGGGATVVPPGGNTGTPDPFAPGSSPSGGTSPTGDNRSE